MFPVTLFLIFVWTAGIFLSPAWWKPASGAPCASVDVADETIHSFPEPGPGGQSLSFAAPSDPSIATATMGGRSSVVLHVTLPLNKSLPLGAGSTTSTTSSTTSTTGSTTSTTGSTTSTTAGSPTPAQLPSLLPANLLLNVVKDSLRDNGQGREIPPEDYTAVVHRLGSQAVQLVLCFERNHVRAAAAVDPETSTTTTTAPTASTIRPAVGNGSDDDSVVNGAADDVATTTPVHVATKTPANVSAGSYTGSVSLESADGSIATTVPVTVKVRYQHITWLAFVLGPIVLIGGGAFVFASGSGPKEDNEPLLSRRGISDVIVWLRDSPIPVALGAGAAVTAYIANTASNPTFGANPQKAYISLLGVTFAAFTTALAAGSASFSRSDPKAKTDVKTTDVPAGGQQPGAESPAPQKHA